MHGGQRFGIGLGCHRIHGLAYGTHMGMEFVASIGVNPALVGVIGRSLGQGVTAHFGINPKAWQQGC
ncbi:hypothetical protein D3C72_1990400 [compost metagenome]